MAKKTTQKNEQPVKSDPNADLLKRVMADYDGFKDYINVYHKKWGEYWDLWNNKSVKPQYSGEVKAFDPMTHQMVESIVDNVYGTLPKLTFMPTRSDQETDTKQIAGLWDYSMYKTRMDRLLPGIGRESEITGNSIPFVEWDDGYMKITHKPIRDCIFDTSTADPSEMKFAGYRRLANLDDLKDEMRYDPTAGEKDDQGEPQGAWVKKYEIPADVKGYQPDDKTDAQAKQLLEGSTLKGESKKGEVEVIYLCYLDKIVEILNRKHVIYQGENPYHRDAYDVEVQLKDDDNTPMFDETKLPQEAELMDPQELAPQLQPVMKKVTVPEIKPFLPVAMNRVFVDPGLLVAKGTVETFAHTQEHLNDVLAAKMENIFLSVQDIMIVDSNKAQEEHVNELEKATMGSIVGIPGGKPSAEYMGRPDMTNAADIEVARAKQSIRDTARVDEVVQGVSTSTDKTATEIKAQVAQASSGFGTKVKALESGMFQDLGEKFYKMIQIFVTEEQMIRILGREGVEFKKFKPDTFWGDYDVMVTLDNEAEARKSEEAKRAVELATTYKDDPNVNQVELMKRVMKKAFDLDEDEVRLLINPNPMNAAMAGGAPVGDVTDGAMTAPAAPPALPAGGPPIA